MSEMVEKDDSFGAIGTNPSEILEARVSAVIEVSKRILAAIPVNEPEDIRVLVLDTGLNVLREYWERYDHGR